MRALLALLTTLAVFTSGAAAASWCWLGPIGDGPHPDDQQLVEQLRGHRSDFDALRVAVDSATPAGGATYIYGGTARSELSASHAQVLDRMRRLGVDVNLVFTDPDESATSELPQLKLAMHAKGLVTSGSIKGLVWSPERPRGIHLDSLDGSPTQIAARGCPEHETCLREIEGGWYLFYSYDL